MSTVPRMSAIINDRDHLYSVVQTSDDAIMTKSLDGIVLTWNPAATRIFGYTAQEMVGQKMLKIFPPDRVHEEDVILGKLATGERIDHFRTQRLHKDGHLIEISATISPICDPEGKVIGASKIARDVTEQALAEREIAQFKALIDSSDDGIISKDTKGVIRTWNAGARRIFGYTLDEALGQHISILFPEERLHEEEKLMKAVVDGDTVRHFRTTRITKNGDRIFVSVSLSSIKNDQGEVIGFSKIVRDLTQEIQQEQLLWQQVHFDPLTGLMSSVGLQNTVDDLIRVSNVRHRSLAVVYCNIKGFSDINARFSPAVGDEVLIEVARALRRAVRESDDVARLHSDHFVLVLHGFANPESIAKAVTKIKDLLEAVRLPEHPSIAIAADIGVSVYPTDGKTFAKLIKAAEQTSQAAKLKKTGARFFSSLEASDVPDDFFIVQALNKAVEMDQLHLEYQPIVDAISGKVTKAEALLRWEHPDFGRVSPATFIPLAEKYGVIRKLSRWVMRQALQDLTRWTGLFGMDFQVSINRSSHDFHDYDECFNEMRDALHEFGLCGSNLIVEVTEYSLVGSTAVTERILKGYRSLGVGIALDDFGTGYSSLDYLKRYPVDFLKIDRSFVESLGYNDIQYQLCDGIISIAKRLDLKVVAEGVETTIQADMLKKMGAEFIQGYLYSKPLTAQALEAFVADNRLITQTQ